jgi:TolA-binding protein
MTPTHGRRLTALLVLLLAADLLPAQAPDVAEQLIVGANRAFNEKNYPFAAARYAEYLQKFNGQPKTQAARYGLAMCYLEGPERDYPKAIENMTPPANDGGFAERPSALYYLGLANRGEGLKQVALVAAKMGDVNQAKEKARQRFEEAARWFGEGANAYTKLVKEEPKDKLPVELEWAARCKCEQAEVFVRLNKFKEAQDAAAPFIAGKSVFQKSKYRGQGLYYHGLASFLLKDQLTAGKSLSLLTPFNDPVFGSHAQYLMGRIHHAEQERPEAIAAYEGALKGYEAQKKAAQEALKQPDRFKNDPEEKVRLETLVREVPDHVGRAAFFLGVMQYEDGRFGDAQTRFADFAKQFPNSSIVGDALLRQGFCQVQMKAPLAEVSKTLNLVAEKYPNLQDQAWFWLGRAQVQAADPANAQTYQAALKAGQDTLRKAADRAGQLGQGNPPDPEAKVRRAEILADLADTLQGTKQHKEAGDVYKQLIAENLLPARREEFTLALATAQHLSGDYTASDATCTQFQQQYPASVFLPAVAFRQAENA